MLDVELDFIVDGIICVMNPIGCRMAASLIVAKHKQPSLNIPLVKRNNIYESELNICMFFQK